MKGGRELYILMEMGWKEMHTHTLLHCDTWDSVDRRGDIFLCWSGIERIATYDL